MTAEKKSTSFTPALIGLLGTALTVAGGLCGALITGAVTVYKVRQESQQLSLASSGGQQSLSVDTGSLLLSRAEAAVLDPSIYYIDLEQGFAMHRSLPGWDVLEEMTLAEHLVESNVECLVACDQPVFRIRYGEAVQVESDRLTTVDGQLIPEERLDLLEQVYGPPPWESDYYSQVILNVFARDVVEPLGVDSLAELIIIDTRFASRRYTSMLAPPGSHYALLQGASSLASLRIEGEPGGLTLDDWLLFAESDRAFYIVEILFTTRSGQPVSVWDDLQIYMDYFRVIE